MKKIISALSAVMIILTVFTACGKENVGDYTTSGTKNDSITSTSSTAGANDESKTTENRGDTGTSDSGILSTSSAPQDSDSITDNTADNGSELPAE